MRQPCLNASFGASIGLHADPESIPYWLAGFQVTACFYRTQRSCRQQSSHATRSESPRPADVPTGPLDTTLKYKPMLLRMPGTSDTGTGSSLLFLAGVHACAARLTCALALLLSSEYEPACWSGRPLRGSRQLRYCKCALSQAKKNRAAISDQGRLQLLVSQSASLLTSPNIAAVNSKQAAAHGVHPG